MALFVAMYVPLRLTVPLLKILLPLTLTNPANVDGMLLLLVLSYLTRPQPKETPR